MDSAAGEAVDTASNVGPFIAKQEVRGQISKLPQIIELTKVEKALLANYHFLSARIPGTRQIRNTIRHMIFGRRIFYGIPVFMTFTPSTRHSGLTIRLFRGRRADPAFASCASNIAPWIGKDSPSMFETPTDPEEANPGAPG